MKYIESIQKVVDLFPTNWLIEKNAQMRILFVWVSENENWLYSGWPDFQLLDIGPDSRSIAKGCTNF